jgi:DNA-binding LytR/AlgR family response regulator
MAVLPKTERVTEQKETIYIRSNYMLIRVRIREILYIKALSDYVIYHLKDGTKYITLATMKETQKNLKESGILRCHRSFLINKIHVRSIKGSYSVVWKNINGQEAPCEVPIGRSYKKEFKRKVKE